METNEKHAIHVAYDFSGRAAGPWRGILLQGPGTGPSWAMFCPGPGPVQKCANKVDLDFGSMLGAQIVDCSCYFFAAFFDRFVKACSCTLGAILMVMFGTFPDFGKNGAPHESDANSSKIEGRAVGKSTKKRSETDGKTVKKLRRKSDAFFVDLASF